VRVSSSQLADFLQFLRGGALSPLLKASETVEHKELQAALRKATQGIAKENRTAVVRLLGEDDPIIAAGAARLAGDLQIAEAGPAMTRLFGHGDPDVRLAAVEAAATLRASSVAAALVKTLEDPERKLRIAAAKALGALQYRPASKALTGIVRGRAIRRADISEKVAVFEAFGVVADANGLKVLDALLNGRGFLGRREPSDIRAAAALALGRIAGPEARAVLEKATQDDDPVVRSNVKRALRHED
ncbi:MAG TPA: HEAT repeat domain-containing protein, partial [Longimicrobiales bacterium]|nr:HEAT repeat domain-containing protein [Longimicrobiales bacterium]